MHCLVVVGIWPVLVRYETRYDGLCSVLCCVIGNSASLCVLGTVHLLPNREIWLWTKSCLMLLSLTNVVPLMTG